MQKDNSVTAELSQPELPGKVFFLDPDSYWILNGNLMRLENNSFKDTSRLGYFFIALGTIFFLLEIMAGPGGIINLFALVVLAYFCGMGFFLLKSTWSHNHFNKVGKISVGKLVSIEGKVVRSYMGNGRGYSTDYRVTATYSFFVPGHQTPIVGKKTVTREDLKRQELPAPGTPVVVLYINPKKHMLC